MLNRIEDALCRATLEGPWPGLALAAQRLLHRVVPSTRIERCDLATNLRPCRRVTTDFMEV
jgi:hypothetical protein